MDIPMRDLGGPMRELVGGAGGLQEDKGRSPLTGAPPEVVVPAPARGTVLLVEPDDLAAARFEALLRDPAQSQHWRIERTRSAARGLIALATRRIDVAVVGVGPGGAEPALAFLAEADAVSGRVAILLLATGPEPAFEQAALDQGAMDILDRRGLSEPQLARALRLAVHRKQASERLDRLVQQDQLTGLGNRAHLHERLAAALAAARRTGSLVAVMMLDLNGFKPVNDRLGHAAGDALLRGVGARLQARLRASDTLARLGGDEFAIVVEGLQRPDQAGLVVRKLLAGIEPPFIVEGQTVAVSASLGVAMYPDDHEQATELVRLADAAMYVAKRQGGNRCCYHGEGPAVPAAVPPNAPHGLQQALEAERIELWFLPQTPLCSDRLAISTLPRWYDPERGWLEGAALAAVAQAAGLADLLGDYLVRAVCAQARRWQSGTGRPFTLSLPFYSRHQAAWCDLSVRVQDELQRHGLPRAVIELELDEALLLSEIESGGATLATLRASGLRLAVDGFGGGSCSLRTLREAPVATVKLASSLAGGVPKDDRACRYLRGVVRFARELRLRVVATGVGSRDQLAILRAEGCDAVVTAGVAAMLDPAACTVWIMQHAQSASPRPTEPRPAMP